MSAVLNRDVYGSFVHRKEQSGADEGFEASFMPSGLFDFQEHLVDWTVRKGRGACFADCGMGKTVIGAAFAENVARRTDKPVLILTPLAVADQYVREGEKFGVEMGRSKKGEVHRVTVANYERLHLFDPQDFAGVVCDESSILKSFDGAIRNDVTTFLRKVPYRLLATATAAPNDYIELGTSSEALGYVGATDFLRRFFRNDNNNVGLKRMYGEAPKWRFRGHAEAPFWRYVASWARACRRPSDLGFEDGAFVLPDIIERTHDIEVEEPPEGCLFSVPAHTLPEQRKEAKRTLHQRCERAAELVNGTGNPAVVWCHGNDEAALLLKLIPGAVEVSGAHADEQKEERFRAFSVGAVRVLITKPSIGAWGLNWQHCAHVVYFPSHSFEQYYQAVRRCWRFGQTSPVTVDLPITEGQKAILANLRRKQIQAERMFSEMVAQMNDDAFLRRVLEPTQVEVPAWLY